MFFEEKIAATVIELEFMSGWQHQSDSVKKPKELASI